MCRCAGAPVRQCARVPFVPRARASFVRLSLLSVEPVRQYDTTLATPTDVVHSPPTSRLIDLTLINAGWLPLESNPEIFTSFARQLGVPEPWAFIDILGLHSDLLAMVPGEVAAVILLFPCTDSIYRHRCLEERRTRMDFPRRTLAEEAAAAATFHVEQHARFGNACGTIAAVHAITNSRARLACPRGQKKAGDAAHHPSCEPSVPDRPYEVFVTTNMSKDPAGRGQALLRETAFKLASDAAANNEAAQTPCPERDGPDLDHHFVAFCTVQGRLVEVDGTKWAPMDHGSVATADEFLPRVAEAIRRSYFDVEPGSIEFSMLALCRLDE